jgi:excisionase family DNA binding protein
MDEWVFTGEASRILRVSESTVRRWADEGTLIAGRSRGNRGRRKISMKSIKKQMRSLYPGGADDSIAEDG